MTTAADIMTREVITVAPDTPVSEVAALLAGHRFGSVPVVDGEGCVVGIVSEEDLITRAARLHLPRHIDFLGGIIYLDNPQTFTAEAEKVLAVTAREIMTPEVWSIHPEMPVEDVAARMLNDDLRRLTVIDERGCLLGIITRADIVRTLTTSALARFGSEHRLTEKIE